MGKARYVSKLIKDCKLRLRTVYQCKNFRARTVATTHLCLRFQEDQWE